MQSNEAVPPASAPPGHWRGLGPWNLYFLAKFALLWVGALNFHPLENLAFAAALLAPLPPLWLHRARHLLAIPVGAALFYYDTWLPPISRVLEAGGDIAAFSGDYLLELAGRFINWNMLGAGLVLLVAYLFFSQWLRITVFSVAMLAYLAWPGLPVPSQGAVVQAGTAPQPVATGVPAPTAAAAGDGSGRPAQAAAPTSANLEAQLKAFYQDESLRRTAFTPPAADGTPFDVLLINICSLSWADLDVVGLRDHPLFGMMDIVFDDFNSATSYSGPAAIRLLRASCGQSPNAALYDNPDPQCFLFQNLEQMGFATSLALNHNGAYQGYLKSLQAEGGMSVPPLDVGSLQRALVSFDGSPIWRDLDVLERWWQTRQQTAAPRTATFYNTITLHDGNRSIAANGKTVPAGYAPRAQAVLDDLASFIRRLEQSGRPVLVLLVPEHGAALRGDRLQIAGLREIPSPDITHVPVGLKLVGAKAARTGPAVRIAEPTSYLAVSELVSRLSSGEAFTSPDIDWNALVADLPQSMPVAENQGAVVMRHQGAPFIRLKEAEWLPYPQ